MNPIKIIFLTTLTCMQITLPWKDCKLSVTPIYTYSQVGRATCGDDTDLACQCSNDSLAADVVTVGCVQAIKNLKLDINSLIKKINDAIAN